MSEFEAVITLADLDETQGFRITGNLEGDWSGFSVAGAGDVDKDGYDDLIIGAQGVGSDVGSSYIVFGKKASFGAGLDVADLLGANGFEIIGEAANDRSGRQVAAAGDINGDGFADVIIGADGVDISGANRGEGASYIVFGSADPFPASLSLSTLAASDGFQISGATVFGRSGFSVSAAGDINGDGFDDVIIGAPYSGSAYVVFGQSGSFGTNLNLSSLDGTNGFKISGNSGARTGWSVASAGDINGDGKDDLLIGAPGDLLSADDGATYVVFGKASGFTANFSLAGMAAADGFKIVGENTDDNSGISVSSAGDVNGDGYGDIIVGAPFSGPHGKYSGASYVVFGQAGGFGTTLDLGSLGAQGFQISGESADDYSGWSVSSAGDVNGDGFDDLIIGAFGADGLTGAAYVVFGKAGSFGSNVDLSDLNGTNGFRIDGESDGDSAGFSVASAGDVNGDGFDDLIIGAYGADPGDPSKDMAGSSFVLFGRAPDAAVNRTGSAAAQVIRGGNFNDTLSGLGGSDTLYGGRGNDRLDGGLGSDTLYGGQGKDTLIASAARDTYTGAGGKDIFVFDTIADAGNGSSRDVIKLFEAGSGTTFVDKIDLRGIDANSLVDGDQSFVYIETDAFAVGEAGRLRVALSGKNSILSGDIDGDATADFQILLRGFKNFDNLSELDFFL